MRASSEDQRPARTYDRVSTVYDLYTIPMEYLGGRRRRQRLLRRARGKTLEVGVGTGLNLENYPQGVDLIGIDISSRMLVRAQKRARSVPIPVVLDVADVERLPFHDNEFDTVTAACVFCSVADPVRGLAEVRRVVKPLGTVLLLEHVRPPNPVLGLLADMLSPFTRWLFGPELNRRTERNVEAAGLMITAVRREGVWREIEARPVPDEG